MKKLLGILTLIFIFNIQGNSQIDESRLGTWYMYFWNVKLGADTPWGLQGDVQHRNWNIAGDLEQLLLRGGLTYKATDNTLLTFGYGNITTGAFGDSDETVNESRVYQEALISNKLSKWIRLKHRFRYEQRWVENQDFRTIM